MRVGIDGRELYSQKRGIGRYVTEICRELDLCMPESEFFVYSNAGVELPVRSERWIQRADPSWLGARISPLLWLKTRAGRLCRQDRLDVFWGTNVFLPRLAGSVRTVITVCDLCHLLTPETFDPRHLRGVRMFFDGDVRRADAVATISRGTRDRLRRHSGRQADEVVLPGITDEFRPPPVAEQARCRDRYGLPESYLLTVAAWEPRKNLETLALAFLDLRRDGHFSDHKLVLVGKTARQRVGGLTRLIERDAGRAVLALGYVPDRDLPALYSGADAFVLASSYEGYGIPALEARACGTRVVVSDTPELREAGGPGATYVEPTRAGIRGGILEAMARERPSPETDSLPTWREAARKMRALYLGPPA